MIVQINQCSACHLSSKIPFPHDRISSIRSRFGHFNRLKLVVIFSDLRTQYLVLLFYLIGFCNEFHQIIQKCVSAYKNWSVNLFTFSLFPSLSRVNPFISRWVSRERFSCILICGEWQRTIDSTRWNPKELSIYEIRTMGYATENR